MVLTKSNPDTDYGYRAMAACLQLQGFIINAKKVYRLMSQYHLLQEKPSKVSRNYVRFRKVWPTGPLSIIEMDIKFQWIEGRQRYGYILTALDCFTRKALAHKVGYSIKQAQVKNLWDTIIINYLQPHRVLERQTSIELRNDNDSRFAAKQVQEYFQENHINQVFTHPYTPEENGHIESFHSILSRSLARKEYYDLQELEAHLKSFYKTYNQIRLHGSLDHLSPDHFWYLHLEGLIKTTTHKNKLIHRLKVPHYKLSGNKSLREASRCAPKSAPKKVCGATTLVQPSV
jgi:putative transposase